MWPERSRLASRGVGLTVTTQSGLAIRRFRQKGKCLTMLDLPFRHEAIIARQHRHKREDYNRSTLRLPHPDNLQAVSASVRKKLAALAAATRRRSRTLSSRPSGR